MTGWTGADAAELDALVSELVHALFVHRERGDCPHCSRCPEPDSWRAHLQKCAACRGDTPLTSGPPCPAKRAGIEHALTCPSCWEPCPKIRAAIEAVATWRERRALLSRAVALRAEEHQRAGETAA
jgi:hypothetical protein